MRHLNGAKFGSAPDQFRAKTAMVGVCSTFAFATETTVEELKNCSKNENTAKSTGFWLSFWKNWCVGKEITDEIENYEPAELNTLLEHFYAEVNNKKGEDYEPESLKVMMASLDRHLNIGVRAGGASGAAAPPNFGQLRFFGQQEKIWAKPVFKDVSMFLLLS